MLRCTPRWARWGRSLRRAREHLLTLSNARHRELFREFAQLELDTGGPDPHMAIMGDRTKSDEPVAAAWAVGTYIIPYTVAGGQAISGDWTPPLARAGGYVIRSWVKQNWAGIPSRRERRAVWSVEKMSACIEGYANWLHYRFGDLLATNSYDEAWAIGSEVPYFGRYATIKLLEGLHRYAGFKHAMPDIRPRGAWSPRLTLSLMEDDPALKEEADSDTVNYAAESFRLWVQQGLSGHQLDYFRYETLLCNYRQAIEGKYPGRPHDTELKYWRKGEAFWGPLLDSGGFYAARERLFDHRFLGEKQGWTGPREELEATAVDYGYFWSDKVYDYHASRHDLAHPVRWS